MGDKNTNFIQSDEEFALFQRGPVMVVKWLNDEPWTVTSISDNVEQILGYQSLQLVREQKSYKKLLHPDDLPHAIAEHEEFLPVEESLVRIKFIALSVGMETLFGSMPTP